jgi:hypothetical protein
MIPKGKYCLNKDNECDKLFFLQCAEEYVCTKHDEILNEKPTKFIYVPIKCSACQQSGKDRGNEV